MPPLSNHPSRAATAGTERQPASPLPLNAQQQGSGLPSATTSKENRSRRATRMSPCLAGYLQSELEGEMQPKRPRQRAF